MDGRDIAALVEEHYKLLVRYASSFVGSSWAEDMVADATVTALRYAPTLREETARSWLYVVVKHECYRHLGRRQKYALHDELPYDVGEDPTDSMIGQLDAIAAVAALKPHEAAALVALASGASYADIREAWGWTHTKVNRCVYEGRAAARLAVA